MTIPALTSEHLYKYIWGIVNNKNCKLYRIDTKRRTPLGSLAWCYEGLPSSRDFSAFLKSFSPNYMTFK